MKKLIKLFYALTVSALIIFASGVSVSADDANIEPYAFVCAPNRSVEVVGKSYTTQWGPSSRWTNNTSVIQSGSVELSRTIGSSFGVSGETNINLLMYSVKVNAEVTLNTSYTQTWTQNVSVPPYKTVIAKGGTDRVKGTAYILTLNSDCSITKGNPFSYNYGYRKAYTWD